MKDILKMLEADCRLTVEQLSERTGREVEEIEKIIKDAEEKKIIRRYKAVIDWERVDTVEATAAFIEVKVTPMRDVGFDAIAERIMKFPEVRSLYLLSGSYDMHVVVQGKDLREIAGFVNTKLAALDNVLSTSTHFVLRGYKVDGDMLVDVDESGERLPMSVV